MTVLSVRGDEKMNELETLSTKLIVSLNNFFTQNRIKSTVLNGNLMFVNWNVSVSITITDKKIDGTNYIMTEKYVITSPEWDKELVDFCCSMGETEEELIKNATKNAAYGILTPVFMYNNGDITAEEESFSYDKKHLWNVYVGSPVTVGFDEDAFDMENSNIYWDSIKYEVLKNLGEQKTSFVKIFMCYTDNGEIVSECIIDGTALPIASDILKNTVLEWNINKYCSYKQYILISQDRTTYVSKISHKKNKS